MASEEVLNFLDSYWFGHNILGQKLKLQASPFVAVEEETKISNIMASSSNLEIRSISARCLRYEPTSPFKDYSSPKSVITSPKLQTIQSGKDISGSSKDEIVKNEQNRQHGRRKKMLNSNKTKGLSRSLSDLEYEEVKGFMDLGFVFSEKDKDSILVSIIPGLQRWGFKKNEDEVVEHQNEHAPIPLKYHPFKRGSGSVQSYPSYKREAVSEDDEVEEEKMEKEKILDDFEGSISRPYLSEAWEVLEQRKANRQLRKWKLPSAALVDESNIKNHLKAWAQTVASTVR